MKLSSGKSVAAWSTSATSKASLSSGQIVGPLCTWMFLMPELLALLQVPVGLRVGQLPAARALVPLGGVELDALGARTSRRCAASCFRPGVALAGVPAGVDDELARVLLGQRAVLLGGVEAVRVPLASGTSAGRSRRRRGRPRRRPSSGRPRSTSGTSRSASGSPAGARPCRRGSTRSSPWRTAPRPAPSSSGLASQKCMWRVDDEVLLAVLLVHRSSSWPGSSAPLPIAASSKAAGRSRCTPRRPRGWRT